MNTLFYANQILMEEIKYKPLLQEQTRVIHVSALLHDMIDKKYVNTDIALNRLHTFFVNDFRADELEAIENIITTMSYSTVRKQGYPHLGEYQIAYHIVREADLLCAYDFDRCLSYTLHKDPMREKQSSRDDGATSSGGVSRRFEGGCKASGLISEHRRCHTSRPPDVPHEETAVNFHDAYRESSDFFQQRVFRQIDDGLYFTQYARRVAPQLQENARARIWFWKQICDMYPE